MPSDRAVSDVAGHVDDVGTEPTSEVQIAAPRDDSGAWERKLNLARNDFGWECVQHRFEQPLDAVHAGSAPSHQ